MGRGDTTGLANWLAELRSLHERARTDSLTGEERRRYVDEREALARALLIAQRFSIRPGQTPRQSLRVTSSLQVQLNVDEKPIEARTIDLAPGGFAVLLATPLRVGNRPSFALQLSSGAPLVGVARVVNLQRKGNAYRVAFVFEGLSDDDAERVEFEVFEVAFSGIAPR